MKIFNALNKIGLQPFVLCIFAAILLANFLPQIGASRSDGVDLGDVATWGVGAIFFFYGLRLDGGKLASGLKNVKLHCLVQFSTFALFPLLVIFAMRVFSFGEIEKFSTPYYLWIGMFFLAALPSTVSSSVVMVALARGNMSAAIFNASFSSLAGIFITPLWTSLFIANKGATAEMGDILLKLILQVFVPLALGMLLNGKLGQFAEKNSSKLRVFDQSVILLIIYTSFCDSFKKDMFSSLPPQDLLVLFAAVLALFFAALALIFFACKIFGFERGDTIAAVFCGSKKSLVHGSVMSKILLPDPALAGVVLLPVMIYHALQIVIISAIAKKLGSHT